MKMEMKSLKVNSKFYEGLGMQAKECQYTGIASSTYLTKVNRPCYSASCRLGKARPNHKESATTWESRTSRVTRSLLGGDPGDPRGIEIEMKMDGSEAPVGQV